MSRRKNYKFTDKKHSYKAIMAAILGTISLVSLGIVLYLSYQSAGDVPPGYGVTGLLIVLFSVTGFILGLITVREKGKYYRLFPVLGILFNLLALLGIGLILYVGM